jgi:membrane associated rhomboid family serine protease
MSDLHREIQFQMPSPSKLFTPAVTVIMILIIIGYTLFHYAFNFTTKYLCLSSEGLFSGKIWQLVTYPFVNSCIGNFLVALSIVLFMGSNIEREWRTRSFVILWLTVSVICGLIWLLVTAIFGQNIIGMGTAPCVFGLIAMFGLLLRKTKFIAFFWPVEAQFIAWLLLGIGFLIGITMPIMWTWLSGALVAYLYIKISWKMSARQTSYGGKNSQISSFSNLD